MLMRYASAAYLSIAGVMKSFEPVVPRRKDSLVLLLVSEVP